MLYLGDQGGQGEGGEAARGRREGVAQAEAALLQHPRRRPRELPQAEEDALRRNRTRDGRRSRHQDSGRLIGG